MAAAAKVSSQTAFPSKFGVATFGSNEIVYAAENGKGVGGSIGRVGSFRITTVVVAVGSVVGGATVVDAAVVGGAAIVAVGLVVVVGWELAAGVDVVVRAVVVIWPVAGSVALVSILSVEDPSVANSSPASLGPALVARAMPTIVTKPTRASSGTKNRASLHPRTRFLATFPFVPNLAVLAAANSWMPVRRGGFAARLGPTAAALTPAGNRGGGVSSDVRD